MIIYKVELTHLARSDLFNIIEYFSSKAGGLVANQKLTEIESAIATLKELPDRGHKPHEMYNIITANQLEIIVNNIRIIYEIQTDMVYVIAIFDGRQNVKAHLQKRTIRFH